MPTALEDQVETYSVSVMQTNYLPFTRVIRLSLASGRAAYIGFQAVPPDDWLQFLPDGTNLVMSEDVFAQVYGVLETESPVFFTALDLGVVGFRIGSVHTELEVGAWEPPGEGDEDPRRFEALVRDARAGSEGTA